MKLKQNLTNSKLKPYKIPSDMVFLIDTREQLALCTKIKGLTVRRETLKHGDYSIQGCQKNGFIIERKSSDLYSYIGSERDRTVKKLKALSAFEFAGLVIEYSFDDLMVQNMYSQITPEMVRQFLISVQVRYGFHVFMNHKRENCEQFVLDSAIKYYNVKREV